MPKYRNKTLDGKRKEFIRFMRGLSDLYDEQTDDEVFDALRHCADCGVELYTKQQENWAILEFDSPIRTLEIFDEMVVKTHQSENSDFDEVELDIITVVAGTICSFMIVEAAQGVLKRAKTKMANLAYHKIKSKTQTVSKKYETIEDWYSQACAEHQQQLDEILEEVSSETDVPIETAWDIVCDILIQDVVANEFDDAYDMFRETISESLG